MTNRFLAFDLGAESGRAILGQLTGGVLDLTEVYRFPNEPVRVRRAAALGCAAAVARDAARPRALSGPRRSIASGIDTWGCDYALLGEHGTLLENPFSYRDTRTDGVMQAVNDRLGARAVYDATGIQFLPFNTIYQLYAACRATPRLIAAADALATIPDLLNFWLSGELRCEYTNATTTAMVDARSRRWATGLVESLDLPTRLLQPLDRARRGAGRRHRAGLRGARRHAGHRARVPRHGVGRGLGRSGRHQRVPQLRHLVAARAPSGRRRSSTIVPAS